MESFILEKQTQEQTSCSSCKAEVAGSNPARGSIDFFAKEHSLRNSLFMALIERRRAFLVFFFSKPNVLEIEYVSFASGTELTSGWGER